MLVTHVSGFSHGTANWPGTSLLFMEKTPGHEAEQLLVVTCEDVGIQVWWQGPLATFRHGRL